MVSIRLVKREVVTDEIAVRFLGEAKQFIQTFDKVYRFLCTDMTSVDTEENREMGIGWDYSILFYLDELTADLQLGTLNQAVQNMWFAEGSATTKLNRGIIVLGDFYQNIVKHLTTNTTFTMEELERRHHHLGYALGDFIYAMNQICCTEQILEAVLEDQPISIESGYKLYLSSIGQTPVEFAQWLFGMRRNYVSVVPMFRDNPEAWSQMITNLDPSIVETLIDYGDWIYPMDVLAFQNGDLVIDDNYLDLLQQRSDSQSSTANLYPDEWWDFQRKIPAELATRALELEPYLTVGAIDPILKGDTPTKEFFDAVEKFGTGSSQNGDVEKTHRFG